FSSLFATHPPLVERIKVLEPSFDPAQLQQLAQRWEAAPPNGLAEDAALGLTAGTATAVPAADARVAAAEESVVGGIGAPDANAFDKAAAVLGQIPDDILARARSADSVVPLILGLLLADD